MKGLESCVRCGRRYPVERKLGVLGYVHLSEVAEESAQQRIEEIHGMNLKKLALYSTRAYTADMYSSQRLVHIVKRLDSTLRERLHPSVFDTNFKIAGRESFSAQSPTVPGPAPDQEAHPR